MKPPPGQACTVLRSGPGCDVICMTNTEHDVWMGDREGGLSIRDVVSGELQAQRSYTGARVRCFAVSDGKVWVGLSSGAIEVHHSLTYAIVDEVYPRFAASYLSGVVAMVVSDEGGSIFAAYGGSLIIQWDTTTHSMLRKIKCPEPDISCLTVTATSIYVGVSSGLIVFTNSEDFQSRPPSSYLCKERQPTAIMLTNNNKHLWVGHEDGHVSVWHLSKKRCLTKLTTHTGKISSLVFIPNKVWISSWDGQVTTWDSSNFQLLSNHRNGTPILCMSSVRRTELSTLWTSGANQVMYGWSQVHDVPQKDNTFRKILTTTAQSSQRLTEKLSLTMERDLYKAGCMECLKLFDICPDATSSPQKVLDLIREQCLINTESVPDVEDQNRGSTANENVVDGRRSPSPVGTLTHNKLRYDTNDDKIPSFGGTRIIEQNDFQHRKQPAAVNDDEEISISATTCPSEPSNPSPRRSPKIRRPVDDKWRSKEISFYSSKSNKQLTADTISDPITINQFAHVGSHKDGTSKRTPAITISTTSHQEPRTFRDSSSLTECGAPVKRISTSAEQHPVVSGSVSKTSSLKASTSTSRVDQQTKDNLLNDTPVSNPRPNTTRPTSPSLDRETNKRYPAPVSPTTLREQFDKQIQNGKQSTDKGDDTNKYITQSTIKDHQHQHHHQQRPPILRTVEGRENANNANDQHQISGPDNHRSESTNGKQRAPLLCPVDRVETAANYYMEQRISSLKETSNNQIAHLNRDESITVSYNHKEECNKRLISKPSPSRVEAFDLNTETFHLQNKVSDDKHVLLSEDSGASDDNFIKEDEARRELFTISDNSDFEGVSPVRKGVTSVNGSPDTNTSFYSAKAETPTKTARVKHWISTAKSRLDAEASARLCWQQEANRLQALLLSNLLDRSSRNLLSRFFALWLQAAVERVNHVSVLSIKSSISISLLRMHERLFLGNYFRSLRIYAFQNRAKKSQKPLKKIIKKVKKSEPPTQQNQHNQVLVGCS